ncbi:adenylate/guanylate cyclase domain-containing protein [Sphingosinicella terrae]|uniref:adenylate/guanylate cyclase domain-containing protein n=1 Tax=Sphingosinicella terrae TaxID=2172047 RepID=UPI000E0D0E40|nr:adenylate/guanylate cyclase domain-containing protein [Sphingosinicella terrae]
MSFDPRKAASLARSALARGDLIAAYDVTVSAIAGGDPSSEIRHQQVLALARMGDADRAMERFAAYGLESSTDPHERAVGARLLKDRALALAPGAERQAALKAAFEAYHSIFAASRDAFPGINAATLALLAGEEAQARGLAEALLADPEVAASRDYYAAATRAEALLVLGRLAEVTEALRMSAIRDSVDHGARSTTARQLAMVARHRGLDDASRTELLKPLVPPRVAHFAGHMFAADAAAEARLREAVDIALEAETVGFAYGALACGADIVIAEAALARGAELHVVLPFAELDFLEQSVRPGGEGWIGRYNACVVRAASVTIASAVEFFGDPAQYGYGSRMAMGMARLRAEHLGGEAVQIAVWDGIASDGPAGTGADIAAWREQGGRTIVIDPGLVERRLDRPAAGTGTATTGGAFERTLAAILFTDFVGFSTLKEAALPAFCDGVMREIADVLDAHADRVECRNSWGDALYAVTDNAAAAARIALQLQERLAAIDYTRLGLDPGGGGMRIGVHYGPAFRTTDPITGRTTFYGTEVSKTARIEPVTPPGAVFVTEPFAAILALEAGRGFTCRYVGRIPLAKNYGDYPMYRLTKGG